MTDTHGTLQRILWAALFSGAVLMLWMLMTDAAFAQEATAPEGFRCAGGKAVGALYNSRPTCPTTLSFDTIFSFLICNMEHLSSDLMGNMYCGMVKALTPMVIATLTLAVLFFGMGFTIGVIPATGRDFQKFMLKIAFVMVFATQAEYMIGVGYRVLVEGAREGVAIALSGLTTDGTGATKTGADIYGQMDSFLATAIRFATDYIGVPRDGTENFCQNAIFAVLAIMAVAFPPLFFIAAIIIVRVALTFIRGVFGYMFAIVGIAFLMTLSPLFVSFYLFQQTRPYFDKWLGYLVSFALQIVIVFAFLTFIVSIDVKNFSSSLVNIVVPQRETHETTALRFKWNYCTLCDFEVVEIDAQGNPTSTVIPQDKYGTFLGKGELRCKANPNYNASAPATDPNSKNYTPITVLGATAPNGDKAPDKMVQSALLKFTFTALLSLLVLAYIIDAILRYIPSLAQSLAGGMGGNYAPQLGGGFSPRYLPTTDIPGMGNYDPNTQSYTGTIGSFERGFSKAFQENSGNGITALGKGIEAGVLRATSGSQNARDPDPGMSERFKRFLTNPLGESDEV